MYQDLKKSDGKISNMKKENLYMLTRRNQQRLKAVEEPLKDFQIRIIEFKDDINIQSLGSITCKSKVITDETIHKESRGRSVDTRMSKETFSEFEDFANHPKFEYDGPIQQKFPKSRRAGEKLKESLHKSSSPRMHRNSTVKNMNLNYASSNKTGQNLTYNHKENFSKPAEKPKKKDSLLRKNHSNFPSTKNHRSMLKLHENGFKKNVSLFGRDKSAVNLDVKNHTNLDKTDSLLGKYNKNPPMAKIMEVPHTERSNISKFEPNKVKLSKSRSRYDNEVLSSNEKDYSQQYKRKPKAVKEYQEKAIKKSKEESDIIKSLAKDEFNPFLINGQGGIKISQEYSEKVTNKKMFSRVPSNLNDMQVDKSGTFNVKEHLDKLQNEKYGNTKVEIPTPGMSSSGLRSKNKTPNANSKRGEGLPMNPEEYGTKVEMDHSQLEQMVRLKDYQKGYKSDQANPKGQFNKYTSNKNCKGGLRKHKNEGKYKEKENLINDAVKRKREGHKVRQKKAKSRRHKRKNPDQSF